MLCAALAAGCRSDKGETRAANDAESSTQAVSLTGCVAVSPGGGSEFALENVRLAPLGQQPSDAPTHTSNNAIREGSWVRLTGSERVEDIRKHVGQRVTIVGRIRDTGGDTMGTSGAIPAPQQPGQQADNSRAAADESHSAKVRKETGPGGQQTMANGTAPLLLVERIQGNGEQCSPAIKAPENRR